MTMANNIKLYEFQAPANNLIVQDENGDNALPFKIGIRLVNGRTLKAIARFEIPNFLIVDDICIHERFGRFSIEYPYTEITNKSGEKRQISVAFPSAPDASKLLNRSIMQAYAAKCQETYPEKVADAA